MPCVARGLLRAQHLEFRTGLVVQLTRYFPLRPVRGLLLVRDLDLLLPTDISALNPVFPVLTTDCSVLNTYCSALGPSGEPYSIITNEDIQAATNYDVHSPQWEMLGRPPSQVQWRWPS